MNASIVSVPLCTVVLTAGGRRGWTLVPLAEVDPKHDKKAVVKATNIVIGIKQAAIDARK